ncbi:MAG: S1 family peptidase [Fimbriimonas sp.]
MNPKPFSTLALALAASASFAIVIRHDRDDARYRALAERYRGPVCGIGTGGHGTLVAPRWVVTAAHVVDRADAFSGFASFGDRHVPIKAVYLHPTWALPGGRTDLALVELAEEVKRVKPARFYERGDETGKRIVFVGQGYTGTGLEEPKAADGAWRAAQNTITEVDDRFIAFDFDRPPAGDDLEGISGPGDSGGPAFLEEKGNLYILGVSSGNSAPRGQGHCTYGSQERYGRISNHVDWLRATMRDRKGATPMGVAKPIATGWPTGVVATAARDYIEAFNTGRPDAVIEHGQRYWSAAQIDALKPEVRRERTGKRMEELGRLVPKAFAENPNGSLTVLLFSERKRIYVVLSMTPDDASKVNRVTTADMPPSYVPPVK